MYQSIPQHPAMMPSMVSMPGMPPHHMGGMAAHQSASHAGNGGEQGKNILWMGEIDPSYMNEMFLRQAYAYFGEQVNIKSIRDKNTGQPANYCFVEFMSNNNAMRILTTLNGTPIPNSDRLFKLNWASGGGGAPHHAGGMGSEHSRDDRPVEFSIFVGDLSPDVTDYLLFATFSARFSGCKSAEVKTDPATGASRGYGFVRFLDESEMHRAISEMNGQYLGSRPMRISTATPRMKLQGATGPGTSGMGSDNRGQGLMQRGDSREAMDPNNTTVFVGGLTGIFSDEELRSHFSPFGEIVYVKIPPGKGCGFIQFMHRSSAEQAIQHLQNAQIGNSRVRLSWGRSQTDRRQSNVHHMPAHHGHHPHAIASGHPLGQAPYYPPSAATAATVYSDPYAMMMPAYGVVPAPNPHHPAASVLVAASGPAGPNGIGSINDPLGPMDVDRENAMYAAAKAQAFAHSEKAGWRVAM